MPIPFVLIQNCMNGDFIIDRIFSVESYSLDWETIESARPKTVKHLDDEGKSSACYFHFIGGKPNRLVFVF